MTVLAALVLLFAQNARVAELIEELRSDDYNARNRATVELKKVGKDAIPLLLIAAKDSDLEVSTRAKQAIEAIALCARLSPGLMAAMPGIEDRLAGGGDRAAARAVADAGELLDNPNGRLLRSDIQGIVPNAVRGAGSYDELIVVLNVIQKHRLTAAVFELQDLMEKADGDVRMQALATLAVIGGDRPDWTYYNGDAMAEEQLLKVSLTAIQDLDPAFAEPRLLRGLTSERIWRKRMSIRGLAQLGRRAALPELLKSSTSTSDGVRADVMFAIGELGTKEQAQMVLDALGDPSEKVRAAAIVAAGRLKDERVIPRILPLLPGSQDELQSAACRTLGEFKVLEALPALVSLYVEGIPKTRREAETALQRYDARDVAAQVPKIITGKSLNIRSRGVDLLGQLDAAGAVPALEELLSTDDSPDLRTDVLRALGRFRSVSSRSKILPLLDDPNPRFRGMAARTLAELGDDAIATRLLQLLEDADWNARYNAVAGITALGDPAYAAQLVPLALSNKNPEWVRTAAMKGVERLGGAAEREKLVPLLEDGNFEIRTAAAKVLASMGVAGASKVVFAETRDWVCLNGLRLPEDWTRLRLEIVTEDLKGSGKEVLEQLGQALKRPVEWPADWGGRDPDLRSARSFPAKGCRKTWLDAFRELLPTGLAIILEKDRVRVVSHEQALAFWTKWRENGMRDP